MFFTQLAKLEHCKHVLCHKSRKPTGEVVFESTKNYIAIIWCISMVPSLIFVLLFVSKGNLYIITKTCLFKYTENFISSKKWKFSDKNSDIFYISAQNIDCEYSLEPPRQGGSNEYPQSMFWAEIRKIMYTPVNPSFTV